MNLKSDFTVLLAVYKGDDPVLLQQALNSIRSNSLTPYELLVVADGELTSELQLVIENFTKDFPLRQIQLERNVGLARALNVGLASVRTEFVVRADADDFNYTNRFELLVNKLREGFDLVGSVAREVDRQGVEVAFRVCPVQQRDIIHMARKRSPFNHMTVGFRTSSVIDAGGYPTIHLKEDYALWATLLARNVRACNLAEVLVDATAGDDIFMRRGGTRYAAAEIALQLLLVRCGLKSLFSAVIDGALRSAIFLGPASARKYFYINFLRTKRYSQ